MSGKQRLVLPALAGILVVLGLWAGGIFEPAAARGTGIGIPDPAHDGTSKAPDSGATLSPGESAASARRSETAGLDLTVAFEDGTPASGFIHWVSGTKSPAFADLVAPGQNRATDRDQYGSQQHSGAARIEVPVGCWTWLRATGRTEDGTILSCYRRIDPFEGEQELPLVLDRKRRCIHVFVLEDGLRRPAAGREVLVYSSDPQSGGPPNLVLSGRTDEWGYYPAVDLPAGIFSVMTKSCSLTDPPPLTARLVLPDAMPTLEAPVYLVAPGSYHEVEVETRIHRSTKPRVQTKLWLRRVEDQQCFPIPGVLGSGVERHRIRVPSGRYEVGVLPVGELEIPEEPRWFTVDGDTRHSVDLIENERWTEVRLQGLTRNHMPVTLCPRPEDGVLDGEPGIQFSGEYRWHLPGQKLLAPKGKYRWVVLGRTGCWVTPAPSAITGERTDLLLAPATQLEVTWVRGIEECNGSAWIEVRSSSETLRVPLRPRLVGFEGVTRPGLLGRVVVQRGPVSIRLCDEEGQAMGEAVRVVASESFQRVSLDR